MNVSQFHKNMMTLMHHWFPDREDAENKSTLSLMYALEGYVPTAEPSPVIKQLILNHLVDYRTCK